MGRRTVALAADNFYHIYNKSIEGYEIFRYEEPCLRFLESLRFYRTACSGQSYSVALKNRNVWDPALHGPARVCMIAYVLMPTHFHLLLRQIGNDGAEEFMRYLEASYASYFNRKNKRKGPLFVGRFGARLITTDEDMLGMTRYIHLNPASAGLVKKPEKWRYSSYHEYLGTLKGERLCDFEKFVGLSPEQYKKFAENHIDYQRSLQVLKAHLMD